METLITIDGASYSFETKDGKTELKVQSESTPSEDKKAPKIKVPNAWLIIRKNGSPLFAVRPKQGEKPFRIITADKLYSEKIQWFEPLAITIGSESGFIRIRPSRAPKPTPHISTSHGSRLSTSPSRIGGL
ncbi:hypothetical protein [Stutzerimonas chloritidismutans]|uniref:hypothetical protein n=1 Tax=Stutzerimonas chloritidismutans TaxID=203192 RepID=UPI003F5CF329